MKSIIQSIMFLPERLWLFVFVVIIPSIPSGLWANDVSATSGCATGQLCNPLVGGMGLWETHRVPYK